MSEVPEAIRAAYDPERFRADGHRLIDALADQLAAWHAREGLAVPWRPPAEARAAWAAEGLEHGELVADLMKVARASTALAHPRVMAHQVPPPLPGAALAELVAAMLNNGMAVAEMGPAAVPIELAVIDWMCGALGLPAGAGGVLTSGGSLGNLTALLAMRQAHAGFDVWKEGAHAGPPLAVIVSSDAHYSIARTLRIMGWGDGGAISAQVDAEHRLTAAAVERALDAATGSGRRVIGIVASAGSTATGAFDPLSELADLAQARQLWLHVDAAHGGGVALSATHRHLLAGIERADSVVWDAHKLLMMPALVTAVLFKRGGHAFEAFAQQASYLFAATTPAETWWDLGQKTLECTKRAMAVELWTALRVHGAGWFGQVIDRQIALAHGLAARLRVAGFEVPLAPTSNIVCYRHVPAGVTGPALDAHNRALRTQVLEDGRFYIVGTQLPGGFHLRSTIMNPLIEERDLDDLVAHLVELGARCRS
ncbi:MAG: pyridoxal-dependent decarboxylase [Myxococcales bacterium]|nr:pyridoxal-dependent decarboxylase [Myxococcales bacterium]